MKPVSFAYWFNSHRSDNQSKKCAEVTKAINKIPHWAKSMSRVLPWELAYLMSPGGFNTTMSHVMLDNKHISKIKLCNFCYFSMTLLKQLCLCHFTHHCRCGRGVQFSFTLLLLFSYIVVTKSATELFCLANLKCMNCCVIYNRQH